MADLCIHKKLNEKLNETRILYVYPCKSMSLRMNFLQKTLYLNALAGEIRRGIILVLSPDSMLGAIACGVLDHGMTVDRLIKHVLYYAPKSI